MLNELLALYPEAKWAINTKDGTPYVYCVSDLSVWSVTQDCYVMGFDLTNNHHFPLTQFNDIAGITGYISTIVKGV